MAVPRSTWIDDDGTGKTGTVINNAELQKIYNNIDAAAFGAVSIVNAQTGTLNDWAPAGFGSQHTIIYWNGPANATITGLRGGVDGQQVTIKNRGSVGAVLSFAYYSSSSAASNRLVTHVASAPLPVAPEGWITLIWLAATGYWLVLNHEQGSWITTPFSAADYIGSQGGSWTVTAGQVQASKYRLSGRTLSWQLDVRSSVIGGSPTTNLVRSRFGGFTAAGDNWGFGLAAFAGVDFATPIYVGPSTGSQLYIYRTANFGTAWPLGVASAIVSSGTIEVT